MPCRLTLKEPIAYVMHSQFHTQQQYALSTLYFCVSFLSNNKERLVPVTAKLIGFYRRDEKLYSAVRTGDLNGAV